MRVWVLTLLACACSQDAAAPKPAPPPPRHTTASKPPTSLPAHRRYPDLATALANIVPTDARVLGIGELHARTDIPTPSTALDAFTAAYPSIAERVSDLILETWIVDPACGPRAAQTTRRLETEMKRPEQTKTQVRSLADLARLAGTQLHAMTLRCDDYAAIAPGPAAASNAPGNGNRSNAPSSNAPASNAPATNAPGTNAPAGRNPPSNSSVNTNAPIDAIAMLTLTTRELSRITASAVAHRDRDPAHRPLIVVYGGALHNDRFPEPSVAEWSYAPAIDAVTHDHFVEIDLIIPALAAADPASQRQPWFPLTQTTDTTAPIAVWQRGDRSFVVVLP